MTQLSWQFRGGNLDGGRDFGNANVWAFDPTLDVFTREVCQNTLDVRNGDSVKVDFGLFRLTGTDLEEFLSAIGWSALEPHVRESADPKQKFGRELGQGLAHLDDRGELVVLRIAESNAVGLVGAEKGEDSNFAALCRNNLDSNKSKTAGGAFGLGKAVLWRCSALSTVLFHSNLVESVGGDTAKQNGRVFGRCELAWHQQGDDEFAGPGWFGAIDDHGQAVSAWNASDQAAQMLLRREEGDTGTSILIIGFDDPSREGQESVDEMAADLSQALCRHFWPALHAGVLDASVGYWAEGANGPRTEVHVDLQANVGPFVALAEHAATNELADDLSVVGETTRRVVSLGLPPRIDGEHGALTHRPELLIRGADPRTEQQDVNRVALTRGLGMVVEYWHFPTLRIGARPFHAVLRCGEASTEVEARMEAEQFLRIAEPPSHDHWKVTPDMGAIYRPGGGKRLEELKAEVRATLRELVAARSAQSDDGPEALKRMLTIKAPPERTGDPKVTRLKGGLEDGRWSLLVTVTAGPPKDGHEWRFRPSVKTGVESGKKGDVEISEIEHVSNCWSDEFGAVHMDPQKRQCTLRVEIDAETLPGRPEDVGLEVLLSSRGLAASP